MKKHPNQEIFSKFPVIGPEFNLICIDAVKFSTKGEPDSYIPLIRFVMRDGDRALGGFTLRTGVSMASIEEVAEFVNSTVALELFLTDVSASGTLFNENMDLLESIDWNEKIRNVKEFNVAEPLKSKNYLH